MPKLSDAPLASATCTSLTATSRQPPPLLTMRRRSIQIHTNGVATVRMHAHDKPNACRAYAAT
eukprot:scaffold208489_cov39-Tisochrysis_lutea.AAC.3